MFSVEQLSERWIVWLVLLAGAAGAGCRYLAGVMLYDPSAGIFPWATWWCNVTGAFMLAVLRQRASMESFPLAFWGGANVQRIAGTGFLGAYTTFSAIGLETVTMIGQHLYEAALLYVISGWLVGWLAVAAGSRLMESRKGRESR